MPPEMSEATGSRSGSRQKKSKLEKIYELQAANKSLKEENKALKKRLNDKETGGGTDDGALEGATSNEQKLLEAMKALKRVTVKQEMSLNTIKTKATERRKLLDQREKQINAMNQEIKSLKASQKARKAADTSSDIDGLRSEVEDLQLQCSELENQNKMLNLQLEASEDKAKTLQKSLESARRLMERAPSSRSVKSTESSASEFDLARMRKELASKIERIVLLEFDLEMCRDELHEMKQKQMMDAAFPVQDVGGAGFSGDDDWQSEEDDDDDMW